MLAVVTALLVSQVLIVARAREQRITERQALGAWAVSAPVAAGAMLMVAQV